MTQSRYFGQNKLAQAFGWRKGFYTLFFQLSDWWAAPGKQSPNNTIYNSNLHLEAWLAKFEIWPIFVSIWWEGRKSTFWASLKTCSNPTEFAANWYTVRSIDKCTAAFRITKFGAVCAILRHSQNLVFYKSSKWVFLGQFWETAIPLSKRLVSTCIVFIGFFALMHAFWAIWKKWPKSAILAQIVGPGLWLEREPFHFIFPLVRLMGCPGQTKPE